MVVAVGLNGEADLAEVVRAADRFGPVARLVEGRKQHGGEDCDDCNYNQEFNQGEYLPQPGPNGGRTSDERDGTATHGFLLFFWNLV